MSTFTSETTVKQQIPELELRSFIRMAFRLNNVFFILEDYFLNFFTQTRHTINLILGINTFLNQQSNKSSLALLPSPIAVV